MKINMGFFNTRDQSSLERWLILALGQEIHKMGLEHLVVPESREVLKNKAPTVTGHVKGTESSQWPRQNHLSNRKRKTI